MWEAVGGEDLSKSVQDRDVPVKRDSLSSEGSPGVPYSSVRQEGEICAWNSGTPDLLQEQEAGRAVTRLFCWRKDSGLDLCSAGLLILRISSPRGCSALDPAPAVPPQGRADHRETFPVLKSAFHLCWAQGDLQVWRAAHCQDHHLECSKQRRPGL